MNKTSPLVRIFLGISISFLIGGCLNYIQGNLVVELKLYLRLSIAVVILAALYIKEFSVNNNFLISAKDSYPYFISCYLFDIGTWLSWGLAFLLILWDFAGEG